jgi:putative tryptophan/tyrosine transport system substrate-binding protein
VKRREFIAALGGAAAWPLVARAQQPTPVRRVAVLMAIAANDPEAQARAAALERGLRDHGWDRTKLRVEYHWAGGDQARIQSYAAEIVREAPDVILANATPVLAAVRHETSTIPIVFVQVIDPVSRGFVNSLARPGGNITGFTNFEFPMGGKWVEILKEAAPSTNSIAVIFNPVTAPYGEALFQQIAQSASALATGADKAGVSDIAVLEKAIEPVITKSNGGLIVLPDTFTTVHWDTIIALAERHKLPSVYPFRYFTVRGGLISYGVDALDLFRRSAGYVDRILKGEKPADLPVQAPTKYELVANLKTAKALGLALPTSLLARADEVIE